MTGSDILPELRVRIRDEGKITIGDDNLLLTYVNEAISWLSNQLIAFKDPIMITQATITAATTLPTGFVKFVGQYPVTRTGTGFSLLLDLDSVTAKYWTVKSSISAWSGTIDFPDQYKSVLTQYAAIATINKMGKPIDQDSAMLKQLNDMLTQARQG
ncbi:MAG: hypothetical protein H6Q67_2163 [Firmicutes bacterium]|nr:hypothetical protein [Bacillota bacterium]